MAKQIRVEQTDLETGEVVQMVALKPTRAPHPFRKEGFVQMSQAAMLELAQNPVSGEARRVLMHFVQCWTSRTSSNSARPTWRS